MTATFDIEADIDDESFSLVITLSQPRKRGEPIISKPQAMSLFRVLYPNALTIFVTSIKLIDKSEESAEIYPISAKSWLNSSTTGK